MEALSGSYPCQVLKELAPGLLQNSCGADPSLSLLSLAFPSVLTKVAGGLWASLRQLTEVGSLESPFSRTNGV